MSANVARGIGRVRGDKKWHEQGGTYKFFYSVNCSAESIPEVLLLPLGVYAPDVPQLIVKLRDVWNRRGGDLEQTVGASGET